MEKLINNAPFALVLVFLVIGFILLIKGADFFVEGSSSVAKRLHVPSIIIGLTIVAMGTSLPETAVSVSASLAGNNELAVSNVVGSNIFNLMVVIGVCAMIATVEVARETIRRDIPLSLICAGLLLLLGTIGLGDQAKMTLGHFDGVIFIGLFAGYIFYMVKIALKANKEGKKVEIEGGSDEEIKLISVPLSIIFYYRWCCCDRLRWGSHCRCCIQNRKRPGNDADTDRTYHRFHRHISSGACDFHRCSQKE